MALQLEIHVSSHVQELPCGPNCHMSLPALNSPQDRPALTAMSKAGRQLPQECLSKLWHWNFLQITL